MQRSSARSSTRSTSLALSHRSSRSRSSKSSADLSPRVRHAFGGRSSSSFVMKEPAHTKDHHGVASPPRAHHPPKARPPPQEDQISQPLEQRQGTLLYVQLSNLEQLSTAATAPMLTKLKEVCPPRVACTGHGLMATVTCTRGRGGVQRPKKSLCT